MSLVRDPKGTIWDDESLEKALTEVLTAEVDEDTAQRLVEAIVGVLQDGEYAVMKEMDFKDGDSFWGCLAGTAPEPDRD